MIIVLFAVGFNSNTDGFRKAEIVFTDYVAISNDVAIHLLALIRLCYREVFDEIQEKAAQQYKDEVEAHKHTKETLGQSNSEKDHKIEELSAKLKAMEDATEKDIKSRANVWGWIYTVCFAGLPYVLLLTVIEILKLIYVNTTLLGWIAAGAAVIIAIILATLFELIKKRLFSCAEKHLRNRIKKNEGKQKGLSAK